MWIGHIRHGNWGIAHRCGISVKAQTLVIEREGSGFAETIDLKTVSNLVAEGKHISMNVGDGKKIALIFESEAQMRDAYSAAVGHNASKASFGARCSSYIAGTKVNLVIGTWNLGDLAAGGDLTAWLRPGADLYAVGCQESGLNPVSALSPLNGLGLHVSGSGSEQWFSLVESVVRAGSAPDAWCRVGTASLGNIHLIVLCTRELRAEVSSVESASEAMGMAGLFPNKGVVAVSLRLGSTPLCFVNAHLAAHEGMAAKRNANLHDMERTVRLGCAPPHASLFDLSQRFAHCFLFGDLNYRIDLPREATLRLVQQGNWAELRSHDELTRLMERGAVCQGFAEGTLAFPPTFKHIPGEPPLTEAAAAAAAAVAAAAGDFSAGGRVGLGRRAYESTKQRVPSWCDRVLWRSWPARAREVELLSYDSTPQLASSDHSPVAATFALDLRRTLPSAAAHACVALSLSALRLTLGEPEGAPTCPRSPGKEEHQHQHQHQHQHVYIEVFNDFGSHTPVTSAPLPRGTDVCWGAEQLRVALPRAEGSRTRVEASQLFIAVRTVEVGGVLHLSPRGQHLSLGGGVLHVRESVRECARSTLHGGLDFELPLCRHGAVVGSLRGQLHVELGDAETGACGSWARRLLDCCNRQAEASHELH